MLNFSNKLLTVSVLTLDLLIGSLLVLEFSLSPNTNGSWDILKRCVCVKCTFGADVKWFVIVCVETHRKEGSVVYVRSNRTPFVISDYIIHLREKIKNKSPLVLLSVLEYLENETSPPQRFFLAKGREVNSIKHTN